MCVCSGQACGTACVTCDKTAVVKSMGQAHTCGRTDCPSHCHVHRLITHQGIHASCGQQVSLLEGNCDPQPQTASNTTHTHTHVGPPTLHRPKPRRYVVQRNQILTQENACCTQQAHKSGLRGAASLPRLSSNATGLLPPCRTHKYLERKLFLLNTGGFNATCGDNCAMHSADNTKHTHMQTATITHQ